MKNLKVIIIEAIRIVNSQKPKNFEIALEKLNEKLSEFIYLTASKYDHNVVDVSFNNKNIAHISGVFLTSSGYYSLLEDESKIFFFENVELIEVIYKTKYENFIKRIGNAKTYDMHSKSKLENFKHF